jgi:hypothetical protein
MLLPWSRLVLVASLALASLALAGCQEDGTIDFTVAGAPTSTTASVWSEHQGSATSSINLSAWRSRDDQTAVLQVTFPIKPGTYDCAAMDAASVDVFGASASHGDVTANWQTEGSMCSVTWSLNEGRIVGDFTAHAGVFADPASAFLDASGHFDVVAPDWVTSAQ